MGDLEWARYLVETLIRDRGEQPNQSHYHALILANADTALGSAIEAERLLDEMFKAEVPVDRAIYQAMLKAGCLLRISISILTTCRFLRSTQIICSASEFLRR